MSDIIRFTSDDEFLEELHKDIDDYAIRMVQVVRITKRVDHRSGEVYVIASYKKGLEIVRLEWYMGMEGADGVNELALSKLEYLEDIIKTEDVEIRSGEVDVEEATG